LCKSLPKFMDYSSVERAERSIFHVKMNGWRTMLSFRASTRAHALPDLPCSQLQICLSSAAIVLHLEVGVLHQENLSAVILSQLTTRNLLYGLGLVLRLSGNRMFLQNTVSWLVECQQGIYIHFAQTNMHLRFLIQLSKKPR